MKKLLIMMLLLNIVNIAKSDWCEFTLIDDSKRKRAYNEYWDCVHGDYYSHKTCCINNGGTYHP